MTSKAPLDTLTPDGLDWWSLLNTAEYELLDARVASAVLVQFLLAILVTAYIDLNHKEFKKASDKIFDEVINDCMKAQVTSVDKLGSTILELHKTFVSVVSK